MLVLARTLHALYRKGRQRMSSNEKKIQPEVPPLRLQCPPCWHRGEHRHGRVSDTSALSTVMLVLLPVTEDCLK